MPRRQPAAPPTQLSLFDATKPPSGRGDAPAAVPSQPHPTVPRAQPGGSAPAPASTAPDDAQLLYAHPEADRKIVLGDVVVAYALQRVRRRSIGMVVGPDGLSVRAPRWVGVGDIEAALQDKAKWIRARLVEQRERARRLDASRIRWAEGAVLPYLGDSVILVLDTRITGAALCADAQTLPGVPRLTLHLGLPQTATATQIRDAAQSWLQKQARGVFEARVEHFSQALGVQVKRLRLSSAQTRWGSASADGGIRLNWRLIHFALPTIDYVVVHELAHLRHMDHSPRFWDVVRSVIPDLEARKAQLKDPVVPLGD